MIRFRFIAAAIIVALMVTVPVQAYATKLSSVPYGSQPGVANIQASYPVVGGATDKTGACAANARYNNHHSESWIAVDPKNPQHLVAMSKFFFDPLFYLFHLGAYVSSDGGLHWKDAIVPGFDCQTAPHNSWVDTTDPILAFDAQGNVYSAFLPFSFKYNPDGHQVWGMVPNDAVFVVKSTDGGQTFSAPMLAASFNAFSPAAFPNTTFREGIADNFAVNPANGHLFLALEVDSGNGVDVQLTESLDGGIHWTTPVNVNDPSTVHDGTDQFQPTVSASPSGTVAVSFYDRRLACPVNDGNILPGDAGRTNFCINTTIQFYVDGPQGVQAEGSNIRVSTAAWDPQNPGSTTGQLPTPFGPTTSLTFIGDYFGLALSNTTAYVLSVSNHDSGQNPSHDQQQFLGIVPIPSA